MVSEALEVALKELEDRLPTVTSAEIDEQLSLDEAMAFILVRTPPE